MRNIIVVLLTLFSPMAYSGIIELDKSDYQQVQNAKTYATVCEGFISKCEAPEGFYNIINLSSGKRQKDIWIGGEDVGSGSSGEITVVSNRCPWWSVWEEGPDNPVMCEVSCPVGKKIVSQIECYRSDYDDIEHEYYYYNDVVFRVPGEIKAQCIHTDGRYSNPPSQEYFDDPEFFILYTYETVHLSAGCQ